MNEPTCPLTHGRGTRYGRAEVLGGLINGLFLVFIAFFVFKEALEVSFICTLFLSGSLSFSLTKNGVGVE